MELVDELYMSNQVAITEIEKDLEKLNALTERISSIFKVHKNILPDELIVGYAVIGVLFTYLETEFGELTEKVETFADDEEKQLNFSAVLKKNGVEIDTTVQNMHRIESKLKILIQ